MQSEESESGRPDQPALFRAAEYVRMSTEHQQYSTENQADKIREYAAQRNTQRTEREKRRNARLEWQLRDARAQEAKAENRANTGGTGKKNPNRIRVGISHYGGAGGI